jgi:hypothetical protein
MNIERCNNLKCNKLKEQVCCIESMEVEDLYRCPIYDDDIVGQLKDRKSVV